MHFSTLTKFLLVAAATTAFAAPAPPTSPNGALHLRATHPSDDGKTFVDSTGKTVACYVGCYTNFCGGAGVNLNLFDSASLPNKISANTLHLVTALLHPVPQMRKYKTWKPTANQHSRLVPRILIIVFSSISARLLIVSPVRTLVVAEPNRCGDMPLLQEPTTSFQASTSGRNSASNLGIS